MPGTRSILYRCSCCPRRRVWPPNSLPPQALARDQARHRQTAPHRLAPTLLLSACRLWVLMVVQHQKPHCRACLVYREREPGKGPSQAAANCSSLPNDSRAPHLAGKSHLAPTPRAWREPARLEDMLGVAIGGGPGAWKGASVGVECCQCPRAFVPRYRQTWRTHTPSVALLPRSI